MKGAAEDDVEVPESPPLKPTPPPPTRWQVQSVLESALPAALAGEWASASLLLIQVNGTRAFLPLNAACRVLLSMQAFKKEAFQKKNLVYFMLAGVAVGIALGAGLYGLHLSRRVIEIIGALLPNALPLSTCPPVDQAT